MRKRRGREEEEKRRRGGREEEERRKRDEVRREKVEAFRFLTSLFFPRIFPSVASSSTRGSGGIGRGELQDVVSASLCSMYISVLTSRSTVNYTTRTYMFRLLVIELPFVCSHCFTIKPKEIQSIRPSKLGIQGVYLGNHRCNMLNKSSMLFGREILHS